MQRVSRTKTWKLQYCSGKPLRVAIQMNWFSFETFSGKEYIHEFSRFSNMCNENYVFRHFRILNIQLIRLLYNQWKLCTATAAENIMSLQER